MAELVQDASQFLTGDIFATEVSTRILVFTLHVDCYFFMYCKQQAYGLGSEIGVGSKVGVDTCQLRFFGFSL